MQQQVQQQQQLIAQLQQQALEDRTRHAAEVQHLKASSAATCTALQVGLLVDITVEHADVVLL